MSNEINIGAFLVTRAHLNPDKEALFDVDSEGNDVAPGEPGEVVVRGSWFVVGIT